MQTVTTIGLDIAKSVFQVHGVDATGQVVIRRGNADREKPGPNAARDIGAAAKFVAPTRVAAPIECIPIPLPMPMLCIPIPLLPTPCIAPPIPIPPPPLKARAGDAGAKPQTSAPAMR
jgi:hypothetical protein